MPIQDFFANFYESGVKFWLSGYSDGILCGCTLSWTQGKLTVEPGILRYNGNLYFLKEPFLMICEAQDKIRYLKVQFQTPVRENGTVMGKTSIYLDDVAPNSVNENQWN